MGQPKYTERGPQVACILLTLGRTDLLLEIMAFGHVPSPINGFMCRAKSCSDTLIPIYPKLTNPYPSVPGTGRELTERKHPATGGPVLTILNWVILS